MDRLNLRVRRTGGPWPRPNKPLVAGVNSWGMGGTNCHVLLAEGPEAARTALETSREDDNRVLPWVLSAKTPVALHAQAERLRAHVVDHPELSTVDVAYTLATGRSAFRYRAAVVAATRKTFCGSCGISRRTSTRSPLNPQTTKSSPSPKPNSESPKECQLECPMRTNSAII